MDNTADTLSKDPLTKNPNPFAGFFGYLISSDSGTSAYDVFQQLMT